MDVQDPLPYYNAQSSNSDNNSDDSCTTDADINTELSTTDSSDESGAQSTSSATSIESFMVAGPHKNTAKGALMLLSCFKKHNLTASACNDILKTVRQVLPEVENNPLLHYSKLLSSMPTSNYREVHYCCKCEYILPEDEQILQLLRMQIQ